MILNAVLIVLLATLSGLVVWFHFRFQALVNGQIQLPSLADSLEKNLADAKDGLEAFSKVVKEQGPPLEDKIHEAKNIASEIDYVLTRSEKMLEQFDRRLEAMQELRGAARVMQGTDPSDTIEKQMRQNTSVMAQALPREDSTQGLDGVKVVDNRIATAGKTMNAYAAAGSVTSGAVVTEAEEEIRRAMQGRL